MTISFEVSGSAAAGTTSCLPNMGSGFAVGDVNVLFVVSKYAAPTTPNTFGTWTLLAQQTGGAGSPGADTGDVTVSVFAHIATSTSDTGAVTVSVPGGNSVLARISTFTSTGVQAGNRQWHFETAFGADATQDTSWSATADHAIGLAVGVMLLVFSGVNTDTIDGTDWTPNFSAAGVTFTPQNEQMYQLNSSTPNGDDCAHSLARYVVATGSATSAPVFTSTLGGHSVAGVSIFLRLAEATLGGAATTSGAMTSTAEATAVPIPAAEVIPPASGAAAVQRLAQQFRFEAAGSGLLQGRPPAQVVAPAPRFEVVDAAEAVPDAHGDAAVQRLAQQFRFDLVN